MDLIKSNLGPILLGVIVAVPLVQMVASLLLRNTRRRLVNAVDSVMKEGALSRPDKAWLRSKIETSSGNHLLIAALFAPFAIFGAVALGLYDGLNNAKRARVSPDNLADRIDQISVELEETRAKLEAADAKGISLMEGADPRDGNLWNDPRRKEIDDLVHTVETWSHPIAVLWIFLWLIVAVPFVLVGYAISGTVAPFLTNLWEPLRTLIVGSVGPAHHRA